MNTTIEFLKPNRYVLTCRYCGLLGDDTEDKSGLLYMQEKHEEICPGPTAR